LHPLFSFGVEEPRLRFVGRKKEIDELTAALQCNTEQLWLVTGPGGMGKSQLMKKFVSQVKNENNCVWLHGASVQILSSSVDSLFRRLKLTSDDREDNSLSDRIQCIAEYILNRSNKRPWIFVIDNVDEQHSVAKKVISALISLSNVKTFVTTRLRGIFGGSGVIIELKQLSDEDAQTYVNDSSPQIQSPELVTILCQKLQNHPLALSQAVDYIKNERSTSVNERYNIKDYLNAFRSQSSKLLKHEVLDENTTVFCTCSISMKTIAKKHGETGIAAISLLRHLAYFDPDGIPLSVFILFLSEGIYKSQSHFEQCLGLLKSFSLVWIEGEIISVHRLVQHVTKVLNLREPNRYICQIFEATKLLLTERTKCIPYILVITHQVQFIIHAYKHEHILKNKLKIGVDDLDESNVVSFAVGDYKDCRRQPSFWEINEHWFRVQLDMIKFKTVEGLATAPEELLDAIKELEAHFRELTHMTVPDTNNSSYNF
jgi:energy-coupling factor transporter ATP-binding protein EcfA2